MSYTITLLPFAKQFACEDNETILHAAIRQGFNLRYGCKHGGCGMCKALVVEGEVDNSEASSYALLESERQQGFALLCCAYPDSDVSIELLDYEEEELTSGVTVQQFEAEVERVTPLTHNIRGLQLRLLAPSTIEFKAGQYIDVQVPGSKEWRSYSMANSPRQNTRIELMVKLMPGGLFSDYVSQHLRPGTRLTLQGPYGNFYLRNTGREAVLIAGGSGMAPMLSILRHMEEQQDSRPVTYFYGARTKRDLFLVEELRAFEQRLPQFRFVPTIAKLDPHEDWKGAVGLVTDVVKKIVTDSADLEAYLCGPTAMIDAALVDLEWIGLPAANTFYDKFITKADTKA